MKNSTKYLTSVILSAGILIGLSACAQTLTTLPDTLHTYRFEGVFNPATSGSYIVADPIIKNLSVTINQDFKPLMTISNQKPDSTYHIWIDKKSIKWTSDSTFVLKQKP